jgi:hypothetical protein
LNGAHFPEGIGETGWRSADKAALKALAIEAHFRATCWLQVAASAEASIRAHEAAEAETAV